MTPEAGARLTQADLFAGLTPLEEARALEAARRRRVSQGHIIFHQGEPADTFYLLQEGRVKLTQLTEDGQQVLLRFVEPGDLLGGIAALKRIPYPATAETVDASVLLAWEGTMMYALMEAMPRIALNALDHAAVRVQELQRRVRELTSERIEQRLARALVRLTAQAGERTPEGIKIGIPLSRQDLAELTGTTLYTVSRTLSRWEKEGIVASGRELVVVRSPHRLVAIADGLPFPPAKS